MPFVLRTVHNYRRVPIIYMYVCNHSTQTNWPLHLGKRTSSMLVPTYRSDHMRKSTPIEVITWGSPHVLRSLQITAAYLPPTGLWSCIHWCPTSNWHTPCYQWSKKELNSHIYSYNNHQACREAVEVFKLYTLSHTFMVHHALLCAYNMQQIKLIIHYLLWWQSCISVNV